MNKEVAEIIKEELEKQRKKEELGTVCSRESARERRAAAKAAKVAKQAEQDTK